MVWYLIIGILGIAIGSVGTLLFVRNNTAKALEAAAKLNQSIEQAKSKL